jgi:ATP-dependent Clp protease adaptor protein ClpS
MSADRHPQDEWMGADPTRGADFFRAGDTEAAVAVRMSVTISSHRRCEDAVEKPMAAKVLLLNDNRTTMEFVVQILETIFGKTRDEALRMVLDIHRDGSAVCGIYDPERAWNVAESVAKLAQRNHYPLRCVIEPDVTV